MKTNVFFKAVVMVAVVMASVMSANAGNPTNYVKNDEMNGEQLVSAQFGIRMFTGINMIYG